MNKKWFVLLGLTLILIAGGCAAAAPREQPPRQPVVIETVMVEKEAVAYAPGEAQYAVADTGQVLTTATQDRMIIYNLSVELVVENTTEAMAQLESLAAELGGFVSNSSTWKDEGQLRANVTLRVPADKLDETMTQIRDLALDVESESRSSQDVTEEFTDLDAQLRNRQAYEQELLELLKARREATGKTEDILEVYRELTRVRGEIEQIQGRMNYLSNLSAMATIQVTLTPDALVRPLVVGKWQPQGTARDAIRALINAGQFLVNALIWIVLLVVPILIVILLPPFLILRAILKRRRAQRRPTAS